MTAIFEPVGYSLAQIISLEATVAVLGESFGVAGGSTAHAARIDVGNTKA
jgi:hypothetical protein